MKDELDIEFSVIPVRTEAHWSNRLLKSTGQTKHVILLHKRPPGDFLAGMGFSVGRVECDTRI